jgi:hypothetical protein
VNRKFEVVFAARGESIRNKEAKNSIFSVKTEQYGDGIQSGITRLGKLK